MEIDRDTWGNFSPLVLSVDADEPRAALFVAEITHEATAAVWDRVADVEDAYLQHAARAGTSDVDRSGQDVSTGSPVGHLIVAHSQLRLDLACGQTHRLEACRITREHRRNVDDVSRCDPQDARLGRVIMPEGDRLGSGL
jgi:hypothetical protein